MKNFADENGVYEALVIRTGLVPKICDASRQGDVRTAIITQLIMGWVTSAAHAPRERAPLCINCDAAFGPHLEFPAGFALAIPYAAAVGHGTVSGICQRCWGATDEEVNEMVLRSWRSSLDLHLVQEGNA
jgi:hypothetical protein